MFNRSHPFCIQNFPAKIHANHRSIERWPITITITMRWLCSLLLIVSISLPLPASLAAFQQCDSDLSVVSDEGITFRLRVHPHRGTWTRGAGIDIVLAQPIVNARVVANDGVGRVRRWSTEGTVQVTLKKNTVPSAEDAYFDVEITRKTNDPNRLRRSKKTSKRKTDMVVYNACQDSSLCEWTKPKLDISGCAAVSLATYETHPHPHPHLDPLH